MVFLISLVSEGFPLARTGETLFITWNATSGKKFYKEKLYFLYLLPLTPSSTKNVEEGVLRCIPPLPRFLWRRGLGGGGGS
jgi:hypothetical protein